MTVCPDTCRISAVSATLNPPKNRNSMTPAGSPRMQQLYHYLGSPNRYGGTPVYELHVWAMKPNPRGAFADWHPNVSCAEWDDAGF